jgi:ketosteroid isomerase-like protein
MTISIEDNLAILELSAVYNHAIDYGDADAWLNTFSKDAMLTGVGQPYEGINELTAFVEDYFKNSSPMHHWTNNHIIDVAGYTAEHSCYFIILKVGNPAAILATGRYKDKLKKIDGKWKFFRRDAMFD